MIYKLLNLLFWLAVALYFGGLLALGLAAAPAIFDTTKAQHINLPGIVAPLDPAAQAGGEIFGNVLKRFWYVEIGALAAMLAAILGWFRIERLRRASTWALAVLWLTLAGALAYDTVVLTPEVWNMRQMVRDTATQHAADTQGAAWPERQAFDWLHKRSRTRGQFKAGVLLVMIAVAAWRKPPESKTAAATPAAGAV